MFEITEELLSDQMKGDSHATAVNIQHDDVVQLLSLPNELPRIGRYKMANLGAEMIFCDISNNRVDIGGRGDQCRVVRAGTSRRFQFEGPLGLRVLRR